MGKTNKKHHSFLALFCILQFATFSQAKSGLENYNFLSQGKDYVWMPVVHYQTEKGIYAEARYNYEDIQTLSLYAGKTFTVGKKVIANLTPMLGLAVGHFSCVSLAARTEAEWNNFYLSSESQFSLATKKNTANFFFSWSELGYCVFQNFFAGLATQYTYQQGVSSLEPGFVAGLEFKNISIPFYVFSPFKQERYFILGINFEYKLKTKN